MLQVLMVALSVGLVVV